ncbi:DinB family protein [Cellulomonas marina]|uniref:DinB superfamily protein n=1 Tax=Cellulomonas marina TaxID=988821 RepID=A0A1I0WNU8_9CELL|nr:DinB family protein [Cellulomonas marina]GIG27781.1 hypothetical protein Cma02nite_03810 [Cellulomonas marina]SFA90429.1 DinB superfamily protein [Cellulomonas marina]
MTARDRTAELLEQLTWHWEAQLRPRLDGLGDEEYLWEPVPGCWSVRPEGTSTAPLALGTGPFRLDYAREDLDPAPVTTIAWRLGHVVVAVLADRNARYFGGPPVSGRTYPYDGHAVDALAALDDAYARWVAGVAALGAEDLGAACREPGFEDQSMAALVLHVHREVIHHGAEISLLRDLWVHGLR